MKRKYLLTVNHILRKCSKSFSQYGDLYTTAKKQESLEHVMMEGIEKEEMSKKYSL